MKSPILSTIALIPLAVLGLAGCETLSPEGRLFAKCREQVKQRLSDPDSYREDGKPQVIQSIEGQPDVYSWPINARNAMGGYGPGAEALCFKSSDGQAVAQLIGPNDGISRNQFLALTNPELKARLDQI
jgi:hypothetical protein